MLRGKDIGEHRAGIWEIRLPRLIAAVILGGALSVSGFLLQTLFSNPIAGPFVLGHFVRCQIGRCDDHDRLF